MNRGPQFSQRVVLLLALAVFITMVDRGNLATAAPLLKDDLSLTNSQLGVLLSAFFWSYGPGLPLGGWLAHRFDVRIVLASGLALWSAATLLTGFAEGFTTLLLLRLLLGLGETVTFPCSLRFLAQYLPEHERGRASGLIGTGQALGTAFGTLVAGLLMASFGWRAVFIGAGVVSMMWLLPWFTTTRRGMPDAPVETSATPASYRAILRTRGLWATSIGLFCLNYNYYFVLSWLPLILVKSRGFSVTQMALIGGTVYCIHAVSCALVGTVSDRWIRRGATPNLVRKGVMVSGSIGCAIAIALVANAGPTATVWLLALAGVFFGFTTPMIYSITQTLAGGRAAGRWYGLQGLIGQLAGIIAPIVAGYIVDRTGQFAWAFGIAAAILLIGAFVWGLMVPRIEAIQWAEELPRPAIAV